MMKKIAFIKSFVTLEHIHIYKMRFIINALLSFTYLGFHE